MVDISDLEPGKRYKLVVRHYGEDPPCSYEGEIRAFGIIRNKGLDDAEWQESKAVEFKFVDGHSDYIRLEFIESAEELDTQ